MAISTKQLAKNSLYLYIRSIVTMLISLLSSRLILSTLGVEDFGIYNVVGSVVLFFSFLDGAFSSACLRFYNMEIGTGNESQLQKVFLSSLNTIIILSLLLFVLVEIVGMYLLSGTLNVPESRFDAAIIVFHISALTLVINMWAIPYNSLIIAHESMNVYAIIDIVNAVLKLLILFLIPLFGYDKLVVYALLQFAVQILYRFMGSFYCSRHFKESRYKFFVENSIVKSISSFSFWVLLNSIVSIIVFQGLAILYNIYFGVIVNAALGISNQVRNACLRLTQNFTISFNPQLTQSYAKEDYRKVNLLFVTGSKIIFVIFSIISIPFLVHAECILQVWLKVVPDNSEFFVRILLINCLAGFIGGMSDTLVKATGRIATFQMINAAISVCALTLVYILFRTGCNLYFPYIIVSLSSFANSIYGVFRGCRISGYSFFRYILSFGVDILILFFVVFLGLHIKNEDVTILSFIIDIVILISTYTCVSFCVFFDKEEKLFLITTIKKIL